MLSLIELLLRTHHVVDIDEGTAKIMKSCESKRKREATYSLIATTSTPCASRALRKTIRPIRPYRSVSSSTTQSHRPIRSTHRTYKTQSIVNEKYVWHKQNLPVNTDLDGLPKLNDNHDQPDVHRHKPRYAYTYHYSASFFQRIRRWKDASGEESRKEERQRMDSSDQSHFYQPRSNHRMM
jgi:hypothetical protein